MYTTPESRDDGFGFYKVTFIVNDTKQVVTRSFDSPKIAQNFVNKLKHSKKCKPLSYPLFCA